MFELKIFRMHGIVAMNTMVMLDLDFDMNFILKISRIPGVNKRGRIKFSKD